MHLFSSKAVRLKSVSRIKQVFSFALFAFIVLIARSQAFEPVPKHAQNFKVLRPFQMGERLVYKVSYMGIPAGEAVMEVSKKIQFKGREAYHIISTVESNDFISVFYPVKDRVESFVDTEEFYSHYIKINQRQGRKRREKVIDFDQIRHRAIQVKTDKVKSEVKTEVFRIPPGVQDSLSSLYYFRMHQDLVPGESVFIDVHESNKNWELEIQVITREELKTALGTFKTIKVKALVRYEGVFMDKGDVTLWLTDDEHHIPLLIRTKIKIGHINASLIENRKVGVDPLRQNQSM